MDIVVGGIDFLLMIGVLSELLFGGIVLIDFNIDFAYLDLKSEWMLTELSFLKFTANGWAVYFRRQHDNLQNCRYLSAAEI